jgi:hypothetical protein
VPMRSEQPHDECKLKHVCNPNHKRFYSALTLNLQEKLAMAMAYYCLVAL